ncbi:hypothetical protein AAFX91_39375 [Bradyrhizobium sp. 31Argb]|uniref:hypothetical protein n=1 Tax=Bradyrhizobium sp. 31Argb TaxID=3141247 RepID=UPI00374A29C1
METGSAQRQAVTGLPTSGSAGARRLRGHQEPVDLTILDNVQGKAFVYKYDQGTWRATPIPLPENASVSLQAASDETEEVMFAVSNFLRPTSLYYFDAASQRLGTSAVRRVPAYRGAVRGNFARRHPDSLLSGAAPECEV